MNSKNQNLENMKTSLKDEFCVWSEVGGTVLENELSEEYILPDYLPDIRKILLVKTKAEEDDIFTEDGRAEIGGRVVFNVIYLGDTGEIKCVNQSYTYSNFTNSDNIYDESIIDIQTSLKNRSVRALSPRKLMMKVKVVSSVSVRNKVCVSPRLIGTTSVEDEFTLERKINEIECVNFIQFNESDIRVSEDIDYKGQKPIGDLIAHDADVIPTECKYNDGKLYIKGVARVWCLISEASEDENKKYEVIERNIPITHTSDVSLPNGEWNCYMQLDMGDFECSVANDSYGESRVIEVDLVCRAKIKAISNENSVFTDDVFSTAYEYANTYKRVNTERLLKTSCANFSVSGSGEIPKTEGASFDRVILSSVDVDMASVDVSQGKAVFNGECNVKAVVSDKDGSYVNTEFSFPVRYEMPIGDVEKYRCRCDGTVLDSRVSLDDNKLNVNAEIGINYELFENVSADTVEVVAINKSQPLQNVNEKVMVLYYPDKNETLWSVAKKYNVSRASLENVNNKQLSEGLPRVIVIPTHLNT
ncbi:MAG: DUF3794 domain-containing protein [Ruminococcaceae bacterium]|nr:DUF3794 domain-containing protein [Oscillospiraceae bacterium]